MVLGPTGSFAFAVAVLGLAGLAGLWLMVRLSRLLDGVVLLAGYAGLIALTIAIGRRFARSPLLVNFRRLAALPPPCGPEHRHDAERGAPHDR